jgi:SAM-dependent methyltransferase
MTAYYTAAPANYYSIADKSATAYEKRTLPFHIDLLERMFVGASVCEVGCGTAHLCTEAQKRGANYTGLDWSAELLRQNAARFPEAHFFSVIADIETRFDIVASLYTVEHVVDPTVYLERLWSLCRPGGVISIICPDFVDGEGLPPSFFYGITARRLRTKMKHRDLLDATLHLSDLIYSGPRWKRVARKSAPGSFWINLRPRVLEDPHYSIDTDAVHLSRLKDLIFWFERKSARILARSDRMNVSNAILNHNCYLAVRKPTSSE